jgi:hypothetical protein
LSPASAIEFYVDAFVGALRDGIDAPSPSDPQCLYCAARMPMGGDPGHLREHVEQQDFLGIIALNALSWARVPFPAVVLGLHMERDDGQRLMGGRFMRDEEAIRSALTRYFRANLWDATT